MYKYVIFFLGLLALPTAANADDAADPFARDIKILTTWFEGRFDNEEQNWFENDPRSATSKDDRIIAAHTMHKRVDLPEFGDHVFYVEEYINDDPKEISRQRLVIFSSDPKENAIRMRQGFFKEPKKLAGAYFAPDKLSSLTKEDVSFLSECDVFWKRVASQYEGGMKPKACIFGDGEKRRYSVHDIILSAEKYWRVDTTFLVSDDSLHKGYPVDRPVQMRRAMPFSCDVYFYSESGDSQVEKGLSTHSEGGMLTVTRKSDGKAFDFLIREKEYPYYETRPDFMYFSIRNAGEYRSIAFSVNDPDSRTFGIRTPRVGAFCNREGYNFQEPFQELPN